MAHRIIVRKIHAGTDSHGKYSWHKRAIQLIHDRMSRIAGRPRGAARRRRRDNDFAETLPVTIDHAQRQIGRPDAARMNSGQ
jgi:hypothetical protein